MKKISKLILLISILIQASQHVYGQGPTKTQAKPDEAIKVDSQPKLDKKKEPNQKGRVNQAIFLEKEINEENRRNYNLDPRRYISIYEDDKQNGRNYLIWEGSQIDSFRNNINSQKNKRVDINSTIKIVFDTKRLAQDGPTGNITLKARIGDRKIEVNPYSMVGRNQKNYGIKSREIADFASSLTQFSVNMNILNGFLNRLSSTNILYGNSTDSIYYSIFDVNTYLRQFQSLISRYPDTTNLTLDKIANDFLIRKPGIDKVESDVLDKKNTEILNFVRTGNGKGLDSVMAKNPTIYKFPFPQELFDLVTLNYIYEREIFDHYSNGFEVLRSFIISRGIFSKKILHDATENLIKDIDKFQKDEVITNLSQLENFLEQAIRNYDDYSSDADTKATVLALLSTNKFNFDTLFAELKGLQKKIHNHNGLIQSKELRFIATKFSMKIETVFTGTSLLQMYGPLPVDYWYNLDIRLKYGKSQYSNIQKVKDAINMYLANQFVTATIDLSKSGIKEGESLDIELLWSKDFKSSDDELYDPLIVASFTAKSVGWRLNIPPSIFLINRTNLDSNNLPLNNSPSRFKGSPGVSLLATFNGLKERNGGSSWLERLSPSFGVNVSYLDFDTTKDIEMGVGLVAGIFKNRILFTWGYNLNVPEKSQYIGLGFSFADIISEVVKPSK